MLKYVSVYESFLCIQNCRDYCKKRIALQKCLTFLLERERERESEKNPLDAAVTSLTSMSTCFELGR